MRIIVAGPLPRKNSNGGVAVFDTNIARELSKNNDVLLVSKGTYQVSRNSKKEYVSIFDIRKLRAFDPDIIISSLWYSLFFIFGFKKTKKIHILHGFTNFSSYSSFKFYIMHAVDCVLRRKYEFFLANSTFTKFINEQIFNLKVDGVFNIGLDHDLIESLKQGKETNERENNIIFVGRIVKAKKLERALEAISILDKNLFNEFKIYGYGNEKKILEEKYAENKKISFKGPITHKNIKNAYNNSKVFISLNPSEPFGITYEEALANGLFVIAPNTGGQVKFLKKFPCRVALVDVDNIDSICGALKRGLTTKLAPLTSKELENMSYKKTSEEILAVINN